MHNLKSDFQKSDKSNFDNNFKIFSTLDSNFYVLQAGIIEILQLALPVVLNDILQIDVLHKPT